MKTQNLKTSLDLLKRLSSLEASNLELKSLLQQILSKINKIDPVYLKIDSEKATTNSDTTASEHNQNIIPPVPKYVQYVVLRTDLVKTWPTGAFVAQACHASTAALLKFYDDKNTKFYASDLENMTKICVGVKSEAKLKNLAEKLREGKVDHHLWNEQPENYPTALATKPYLKSDVEGYFKKFNLLK